jgi:hypothetical protein
MMAWSRCWLGRRRLRRLLVGEVLTARAQAQLWQHLRHCPRCRATYDRGIRLERLLRGQANRSTPVSELAPPLADEALRFAPRVLEVALAPRAPHDEPVVRPGLAGLFPLAAAAMALVLLLLRPVYPPPGQPTPEFTARAGGPSPLALRAYCSMDDIAGRPLVRPLGPARDPHALQVCPPAGAILFSAQSANAGVVALAVEDGASGYRFLTPDDGVPLAASEQPVVLPVELRASEAQQPQARAWLVWAPSAADVRDVVLWRGRVGAWEELPDRVSPAIMLVARRLHFDSGDGIEAENCEIMP